MQKLGNIVTTAKKNNYSEIFNVVNSIDKCITDLPILVVGWKLMKSLFPDANILNKEYNGVKWTFTKTERRCEYEEDIIEFYNYSILESMKNINYIYVNPLTFTLTKIKKMINFFKSPQEKILFLTRDSRFLFIYSKEYKTVFGVSLSTIEYIGISKKKILKLIKNGELIKNLDFIDNDIRRIIGVKTHYILPMYSYFK